VKRAQLWENVCMHLSLFSLLLLSLSLSLSHTHTHTHTHTFSPPPPLFYPLLTALQLLTICREYILGLSLELKRRDIARVHGENPPMEEQIISAELAAYFTHCNLQPVHLMLTLRTAQNVFFKLKNLKMAASFARRLLDLGPAADQAAKVRVCVCVCVCVLSRMSLWSLID
jgi:hypothetical protein